MWDSFQTSAIIAENLPLKGYIFHFYTPQVNLISDWALNWSWALEFDHHWGTDARVVRGITCGIYRCMMRHLCFRAKVSHIARILFATLDTIVQVQCDLAITKNTCGSICLLNYLNLFFKIKFVRLV